MCDHVRVQVQTGHYSIADYTNKNHHDAARQVGHVGPEDCYRGGCHWRPGVGHVRAAGVSLRHAVQVGGVGVKPSLVFRISISINTTSLNVKITPIHASASFHVELSVKVELGANETLIVGQERRRGAHAQVHPSPEEARPPGGPRRSRTEEEGASSARAPFHQLFSPLLLER